MDYSTMLFTIKAENRDPASVRALLAEHPEVQFVSLVGIDVGGHDTDEKIPLPIFLKEMEDFLTRGVQTDGSGVVLPRIATLNNAKVDIIPDPAANWFVDYNLDHLDAKTGLPVGTLRLPSFLVHNNQFPVGSRVVLKRAIDHFKTELLALLRANPYIYEYLPIDCVDEIERIELTAATELEFWVKTPDEKADKEQLSTSQILKEQYWKRTVGPVRTALEESILMLNAYGFEIEMGHKEVGGIKAKLSHSGEYDHVMEQLELDWKYSSVMQAADNENQIKYVVRDIFRQHGLAVTFLAKPVEGVAGSGEHTHLGVAARLRDGRKINLLAPLDPGKDYLNPIGFGALMGLLKNYEMAEPFIVSSIDSLKRLKPGFEAPVCTVASLGHSVSNPTRNRTVLVGLVRDENNVLSTHFELRSPAPKNNTYLILAVCLQTMLDGIKAALNAGKGTEELEAAISKGYGEEVFYLEKDRVYRSEEQLYSSYTPEERARFFGEPPTCVWESVKRFDDYPEKLAVLYDGGVFDEATIQSYKAAITAQWVSELQGRVIPGNMDLIRDCKKLHGDDCSDYERLAWTKIQELRRYLGQDRIEEKSLLHKIRDLLADGDYAAASEMQKEMDAKTKELVQRYIEYKKNLL